MWVCGGVIDSRAQTGEIANIIVLATWRSPISWKGRGGGKLVSLLPHGKPPTLILEII